MAGVQAQAKPVYAIVCANRFLRDLALREVLDAVADEADELGPTRLEGEVNGDAIPLADVLDEVRTMSLLGSRRVVIVDDADSFISTHRAALERYCGDPSPAGILIFLCKSLPAHTKLYKIIAKVGAITNIEPPKAAAVKTWIVNRAAKAYGKKINPSTAQMLREHLGDDPGQLDSELSKLTAYVGNRQTITEADVTDMTGHHREEKVFAVVDAMASGDTATALAQWEQVLATDRAAPVLAIGGLAWAVRRLLEARRDFEAGASAFALSHKLFCDADTARRRLESVSVASLQAQQRDLLAADVATKTGASTVEVAIEKFIVTHSRKCEAVTA
jgi:DNA polymerase III subunit delta